MLLSAAILAARYRASHRRPIICRDFKVVISPVGTSRINLCILVPAILYHNTPRSLVRQGTATRNGEYFGTPTSVFETRNARVKRDIAVFNPPAWRSLRRLLRILVCQLLHPRSTCTKIHLRLSTNTLECRYFYTRGTSSCDLQPQRITKLQRSVMFLYLVT